MASPQSLFALLRDAVRHEQGVLRLVGKSWQVLSREGLGGVGMRITHLVIQQRQPRPVDATIPYIEWVENEYEAADKSLAAKTIKRLPRHPCISIVCPTYNPDPDHLKAALDSVRNQIYGDWELCIADDASTDVDVAAIVAQFKEPRFKFIQRSENGNISAASNSALSLAAGEYVTFLDQDDTLSPFALFWVVELLNRRPEVRLIYSDEDKLAEDGSRCDPHFKPDWNYDYQLAHNYLCHLSVYEHGVLKQAKGLREGFEGAQDYDLALRIIETLADREIAHIPRILYHWRKHQHSTSTTIAAKPYALDAANRALNEHVAREKIDGKMSREHFKFRLRRNVPANPPAVTILIPTRDRADLLSKCIESIQNRTQYRNFSIQVIDNGSLEAETKQYLDAIVRERDISVVADDRPFNFSALINAGIARTDTPLICVMNNDIEVINPDWLDEMVANACRPDVGIVGAKLLYDDGTVQHGGAILGIGGVAGHAHKYWPGDNFGYYDRLVVQQELSAVTAACMLIKRKAFDQTTGFDEEDLTVAFNDIDFCLKVRAAGYRVIWTPFARLYHHESKSRGAEDTLEKQRRFDRERDTMIERWGDLLRHDPAYNPNLSLMTENFAISPESRNLSLNEVYRHADNPSRVD